MRGIRRLAFLMLAAGSLPAADPALVDLEQRFTGTVRPFVESYCLECHDREVAKADLDLSPFTSMAAVIGDQPRWELVRERLEAAEMPPEKAKRHPSPAERQKIVTWLGDLRRYEAERNAGDPGPVAARRLSNAEYDYTIRDLTGVDIRPTREFPVDPANQAGFDNSGESLAMSPALVKKYLGAARTVAEHLVLKPDGFAFAPHPVVADTDRDKWAVLRIVEFYKRQPTDYADYFMAAWRFQHRVAHGKADSLLADIAGGIAGSARNTSRRFDALLTEQADDVGPIAKLQAMWRELPTPGGAERIGRGAPGRGADARLRRRVARKNRSRGQEPHGAVDPKRLANAGDVEESPDGGQPPDASTPARFKSPARRRATAASVAQATAPEATGGKSTASQASNQKRRTTQQPSTPEYVNKGGVSLPPAILTTGSSATFKMAAAKRRGSGPDPDLTVPADPAERACYEAAFARFADVFPDAFYITERGSAFTWTRRRNRTMPAAC